MKLEQKKLFAFVFIIVLLSFSVISFYKTANFYVNGEIDYNEWNAETNSKFETDFISNFWGKYRFVELNGALRKLIGQREMNGVIKLNNGYLNQNNDYIIDEAIETYADELVEFVDDVATEGTDVVWFSVPYVVDKYDNQMPIGYTEDFGNDNIDRFTRIFSEKGIETVDLRESLSKQGMKTYDVFYRTDHHWTTKGGFWAYKQIVEYIETKYDVKADDRVGNLDNYNVDVYSEWHLGSRGQRTGRFFTGIDDFELITPKFDTYIQHYNSKEGGTFEDLFIDKTALQNKNYVSRYTYDRVLEKCLDDYWHNSDASIDMKILVVSDSMSKAVMPYMALTFSDVAEESFYSFTGSKHYAIADYKPDVVIFLKYISNAPDFPFYWVLTNE